MTKGALEIGLQKNINWATATITNLTESVQVVSTPLTFTSNGLESRPSPRQFLT